MEDVEQIARQVVKLDEIEYLKLRMKIGDVVMAQVDAQAKIDAAIKVRDAFVKEIAVKYELARDVTIVNGWNDETNEFSFS